MRRSDFLDFASKRMDHCFRVLEGKGKEYDRGDEAFHNFYRGADLLDIEPEEALVGMLNKHLVSILDIVDDITLDGLYPKKKVLGEKITDIVNYLLLLEGLILERMDGEEGLYEGSDNWINPI